MPIVQLNEVGCADRAVDIIRRGGVVILPSDTVYGVFGDATNSTAIDRIYATKKRRKDNPLGIMVDPQDVHLYAHVTPPAETFIRTVFPAPVGIILKKRAVIPDFLTSGLDTVMVMCHSQPIIGEIYRRVGKPLAATSVNISGQPAATTFAEVLPFESSVGLLIDGGSTHCGENGTVLDLTGVARVQRMGAFSIDKIVAVLGPVQGPKAPDTATR